MRGEREGDGNGRGDRILIADDAEIDVGESGDNHFFSTAHIRAPTNFHRLHSDYLSIFEFLGQLCFARDHSAST
jgi:hypothetical protein